MKALGIPVTKNEAREMMAKLDEDGNGTIEYEEFE